MRRGDRRRGRAGGRGPMARSATPPPSSSSPRPCRSYLRNVPPRRILSTRSESLFLRPWRCADRLTVPGIRPGGILLGRSAMAIRISARARRLLASGVAVAALSIGLLSVGGTANAATAEQTAAPERSCSYDLGTGTLVCVDAGEDLNAAVLEEAHLRV